MSRAAVLALLLAVSAPVGAEDRPQPRDATKPLRTVYSYAGPTGTGAPEPEQIPDLPLRLPERIAGETRFHVPMNVVASLPSPDGKYLVSAAANTYGAPLFFFDAKTGKELFRFYGHTAAVDQLQFAPDGKRLFTGGRPVGVRSGPDSTLRVWDVPAKTEIFVAYARCWALTPDAALLVTVEDRLVQNMNEDDGFRRKLRTKPVAAIYDAKELKVLTEHDLDFRPASVAVAPDGKRVAFGAADGTVRVFDRAEWKEVKKLAELKKDDSVSNVAFSNDGKRLAAAAVPYGGSHDGQPVIVWDAGTFDVLQRFGGVGERPIDKPNAPVTGHYGAVVALQFTPDGKHLLSTDWQGTLICWDVVRGGVSAHRKKVGAYQALHVDTDGKRAFLSYNGSRPVVLSVPDLTEKPLVESPAKPELGFETAGKLPAKDAKREITLSDASRLVNADISDGGVNLVGGSDQVYRSFDKGRIVAFDATPDGKTLVTFGHNRDGQGWDRPMKFWDVATGKETAAWRHVPRPEYNFRFSPDGTKLAILHQDGYVRVWDLKNKKALLALDPDWHWPGPLTWSKDGKKLVAGTADAPVLLVWEVPSAKPEGVVIEKK